MHSQFTENPELFPTQRAHTLRHSVCLYSASSGLEAGKPRTRGGGGMEERTRRDSVVMRQTSFVGIPKDFEPLT